MNQQHFDSEADTFIPPMPQPDKEPIGMVTTVAYADKCNEVNGWKRTCKICLACLAISLATLTLALGGLVWLMFR